MDLARRMQGKGFVAPDARIHWPELMRFKKTSQTLCLQAVEQFNKA